MERESEKLKKNHEPAIMKEIWTLNKQKALWATENEAYHMQ